MSATYLKDSFRPFVPSLLPTLLPQSNSPAQSGVVNNKKKRGKKKGKKIRHYSEYVRRVDSSALL
jgi:hypothetical protein